MNRCNRGEINKWAFSVNTTLDYFLLSLTSRHTALTVNFISDPVNTKVVGSHLYVYFTETTTEDKVNGDVSISPAGDWDLKLYEQSSSTNLDPDLADTLLLEEVILVLNASAAVVQPTGECECASSGGDGTVLTTINFNGSQVYSATLNTAANNVINVS